MSVASLRQRYGRLRHEARSATVGKLSPLVGTEFQLTEISGRALDAAASWKSAYYDWPKVLRQFGEPDRLDLALWAGERLLALGIATTRTNALWIERIEGNPDRSSPVTGARLVILFDAFANYAQLRSRPELRLEAKNAGLAALYENAYGLSVFFRQQMPYIGGGEFE